ncbi:hypothetical protein [Sphingopyxis sp. GW247-27LB]|uniref:hypothetical protein n=1 Tax=Sphingopyxis sp. GW247-27LB TaxID=2012632 RepID=UPI000BA64C3D|nr:hypothetical protein [Sphingopyxis sp. GW247-27LB]PAL23531.1 hypothetical protein CD928_05545 [Sphingopyxis sp. GW247-27LB]
MADVTTSYKNADVYGRAAFEVLDTFTQDNLLAGSEPPLRPALVLPGLASTDFAQFEVVGIDANGFVAPAEYDDVNAEWTVKPFGVIAHSASIGAGGANVHVWYSGCFALEGPLVWDASIDTDALKTSGFIGALTPSQIIVRSREA